MANQVREEILTCALAVFREKGFGGSSIEGIAKRAGVSKNTIYLQFRTKEVVFEEAAKFGLANVHEQVDIEVNREASFEQAVLTIIRHIQELAADSDIRSLTRLLIAEAQRFPEIASAMHGEFRKMMKPVAKYLREAATANALSIDDTTQAAHDLTILALGGFDFLLSEPENQEILSKERAITLRDMLVKGWQR
jgi:AcrR family transcriptional regulator